MNANCSYIEMVMDQQDVDPIDRQWLKNLLQKHHSSLTDEQQQTHSKLIAKYPILRDKALVVAPMVEQSDLPFRILCRKYGANICFTPMIHARFFVKKKSYREKMFRFARLKQDQPLIAQICGNNKEILLEAAKMLEGYVDAIDINCGCPTKTAKRGRYGAFLLESRDYLVDVVKYLVDNLTTPLTVKVRILSQGLDESLKLYRKLAHIGISMLTVHGRTRSQKGEETGKADWHAIKKVVECVGDQIPVIANGSISNLDDVRECLEYTGADGVMSSESILEYPALFSDTETKAVDFKRIGPGRVAITREYLELCKEYPPHEGGGGTEFQCIQMHMQVFLHADFKNVPKLGDSLFGVRDLNVFHDVLNQVEAFQSTNNHSVEKERLTWYVRHRETKDNDKV